MSNQKQPEKQPQAENSEKRILTASPAGLKKAQNDFDEAAQDLLDAMSALDTQASKTTSESFKKKKDALRQKKESLREKVKILQNDMETVNKDTKNQLQSAATEAMAAIREAADAYRTEDDRQKNTYNFREFAKLTPENKPNRQYPIGRGFDVPAGTPVAIRMIRKGPDGNYYVWRQTNLHPTDISEHMQGDYVVRRFAGMRAGTERRDRYEVESTTPFDVTIGNEAFRVETPDRPLRGITPKEAGDAETLARTLTLLATSLPTSSDAAPKGEEPELKNQLKEEEQKKLDAETEAQKLRKRAEDAEKALKDEQERSRKLEEENKKETPKAPRASEVRLAAAKEKFLEVRLNANEGHSLKGPLSVVREHLIAMESQDEQDAALYILGFEKGEYTIRNAKDEKGRPGTYTILFSPNPRGDLTASAMNATFTPDPLPKAPEPASNTKLEQELKDARQKADNAEKARSDAMENARLEQAAREAAERKARETAEKMQKEINEPKKRPAKPDPDNERLRKEVDDLKKEIDALKKANEGPTKREDMTLPKAEDPKTPPPKPPQMPRVEDPEKPMTTKTPEQEKAEAQLKKGVDDWHKKLKEYASARKDLDKLQDEPVFDEILANLEHAANPAYGLPDARLTLVEIIEELEYLEDAAALADKGAANFKKTEHESKFTSAANRNRSRRLKENKKLATEEIKDILKRDEKTGDLNDLPELTKKLWKAVRRMPAEDRENKLAELNAKEPLTHKDPTKPQYRLKLDGRAVKIIRADEKPAKPDKKAAGTSEAGTMNKTRDVSTEAEMLAETQAKIYDHYVAFASNLYTQQKKNPQTILAIKDMFETSEEKKQMQQLLSGIPADKQKTVSAWFKDIAKPIPDASLKNVHYVLEWDTDTIAITLLKKKNLNPKAEFAPPAALDTPEPAAPEKSKPSEPEAKLPLDTETRNEAFRLANALRDVLQNSSADTFWKFFNDANNHAKELTTLLASMDPKKRGGLIDSINKTVWFARIDNLPDIFCKLEWKNDRAILTQIEEEEVKEAFYSQLGKDIQRILDTNFPGNGCHLEMTLQKELFTTCKIKHKNSKWDFKITLERPLSHRTVQVGTFENAKTMTADSIAASAAKYFHLLTREAMKLSVEEATKVDAALRGKLIRSYPEYKLTRTENTIMLEAPHEGKSCSFTVLEKTDQGWNIRQDEVDLTAKKDPLQTFSKIKGDVADKITEIMLNDFPVQETAAEKKELPGKAVKDRDDILQSITMNNAILFQMDGINPELLRYKENENGIQVFDPEGVTPLFRLQVRKKADAESTRFEPVGLDDKKEQTALKNTIASLACIKALDTLRQEMLKGRKRWDMPHITLHRTQDLTYTPSEPRLGESDTLWPEKESYLEVRASKGAGLDSVIKIIPSSGATALGDRPATLQIFHSPQYPTKIGIQLNYEQGYKKGILTDFGFSAALNTNINSGGPKTFDIHDIPLPKDTTVKKEEPEKKADDGSKPETDKKTPKTIP